MGGNQRELKEERERRPDRLARDGKRWAPASQHTRFENALFQPFFVQVTFSHRRAKCPLYLTRAERPCA